MEKCISIKVMSVRTTTLIVSLTCMQKRSNVGNEKSSFPNSCQNFFDVEDEEAFTDPLQPDDSGTT